MNKTLSQYDFLNYKSYFQKEILVEKAVEGMEGINYFSAYFPALNFIVKLREEKLFWNIEKKNNSKENGHDTHFCKLNAFFRSGFYFKYYRNVYVIYSFALICFLKILTLILLFAIPYWFISKQVSSPVKYLTSLSFAIPFSMEISYFTHPKSLCFSSANIRKIKLYTFLCFTN